MPDQVASLSLTVTLLVAMWVSVSRCGISEAPGCDNGKLSLDRDLPAAAFHWDCPLSSLLEITQGRPGRDTVYIPEPARRMCMKEAIVYHHTIPNSGAYRPVGAESGEYVYCPPQRWLNNLHHGAAVLLFHPCAPLHERNLLAVLARSCLSDYVITPHPHLSQRRPIALVSWARTLELSTVASLDVCHWLESTTASRNEWSAENDTRTYDLLLTRPAKLRRLQRPTHTEVTVRQCCEQTVSQRLREAAQAELESGGRKGSSTGDGRHRRAAVGDAPEDVKDEREADTSSAVSASDPGDVRSDATAQGAPEASPSGNTTLSDPLGQTHVQSMNQSLALESNVSRSTGDSPELQPDSTTTQTGAQTDEKIPNPPARAEVGPDAAAQPGAPDIISEAEAAEAAEERGTDSKENGGGAAAKTKGNDIVDVKERELEHKQTHGALPSHHESGGNNFDLVSQSQSALLPHSNPQAAADQDCHGCEPGERCDCPGTSEADGKAAVMGLPKTPRSDEAVWAAAALGFLLVLLTLSVLHTRLYRHWRTAPSLYWHDPRQDYDSVADVIQRRLRIANRRRKRSRRRECVLLPSSSSSDELA